MHYEQEQVDKALIAQKTTRRRVLWGLAGAIALGNPIAMYAYEKINQAREKALLLNGLHAIQIHVLSPEAKQIIPLLQDPMAGGISGVVILQHHETLVSINVMSTQEVLGASTIWASTFDPKTHKAHALLYEKFSGTSTDDTLTCEAFDIQVPSSYTTQQVLTNDYEYQGVAGVHTRMLSLDEVLAMHKTIGAAVLNPAETRQALPNPQIMNSDMLYSITDPARREATLQQFSTLFTAIATTIQNA